MIQLKWNVYHGDLPIFKGRNENVYKTKDNVLLRYCSIMICGQNVILCHCDQFWSYIGWIVSTELVLMHEFVRTILISILRGHLLHDMIKYGIVLIHVDEMSFIAIFGLFPFTRSFSLLVLYPCSIHQN